MRLHSRIAVALAATGLLVSCGGGTSPDAGTPAGAARERPASIGAPATPLSLQRLALPASVERKLIDTRLARSSGTVDVWVSLTQPSVAAFKSAQLEARGLEMQIRPLGTAGRGPGARSAAPAEQALAAAAIDHRANVVQQQDALAPQLRALGASELARVQVAHNAVALRVDAAALRGIAALPGVAAVRPVVDYRMALSETTRYVGAVAAHRVNRDGYGVRVAVLDSGIDYTHRNLGGAGTTAGYEAAYGTSAADPRNKTRDALFPTAKVVDGYDFVGEAWPKGELAPDDDPIDVYGHGTHVADIVAGRSADGRHKGVAPGASLLAVKVCSAVSTSCSGIALLQGMDFALDPNGDGDTSDAADVINLSLGFAYGQREDDLAAAVDGAVRLGVVVVASAGNSSNRPYITGSPASARGAISVAQTQVPSAVAIPLQIVSPASMAGTYGNTATVDWAPIGNGFSGDVVPAGLGCGALTADVAGKVALLDRGTCNVSTKTDSAAKAGAIGVLIALNAPGDAVPFAYGGGDKFVPTLVIQQALGNAIKANLPVSATVSPGTAIALVGSMVGSSARGPSMGLSAIKPEIGAPGASVSAVAGTGNGQAAFGGTSGAAPMVAGAAAILVQAFPTRTPLQIKALLMNSANKTVYDNPATMPGKLSPITRVGAGELRLNRALGLTSVARDKTGGSAALSFGFHDVTGVVALERTLLVENFGAADKRFTITPSFRYADDRSSGAVRVVVASDVWVRARSRMEVPVLLYIDGSRLPAWTLNGGSRGGAGELLEGVEFDGHLALDSGNEVLSVPWHVLARKAAAVTSEATSVAVRGSILLRNRGVETGDLDVFSLTGRSPMADPSLLPRPGDNYALVDLRAVGVRLAAPGYLQFAIDTFGRRSHPNYPAEFDITIDTDRDGIADHIVYNAELTDFGATGQNLIWVGDLATGNATAYFYADADLNSSVIVMTVPTTALGIGDGTKFDFSVFAADNYFTGELTDAIGPMTYTGARPRYVATDVPDSIAAQSTAVIGTLAVPGGSGASPSQSGLMLLHRRNAGLETSLVRIQR